MIEKGISRDYFKFIFAADGEVFVVDEAGDDEKETDVGGGHDWFAEHHGYQEERKEGGEVAHLVDESRIGGNPYGHAEANERYAHLKRANIDA